MAVMQTQPNKYTQAFLTVVGLFLLVLSVTLNHYHPRNEGIASITHRNIYQLKLDVAQGSSIASNTRLGDLAYLSRTYVVTANEPESIPSLPTDDSSNAPSQDPNLPALITSEADCAKLDEHQFGLAKKAYEDSYSQYEKSRAKTENSFRPLDSQAPAKIDTYYQTYQNALESHFAGYQLAVLNKGCQPGHPMPAAQPR
jgi:hypothetical protein